MSPNNYKNVTNDFYKYDQLRRQNQPNRGEISQMSTISQILRGTRLWFSSKTKKVSKL